MITQCTYNYDNIYNVIPFRAISQNDRYDPSTQGNPMAQIIQLPPFSQNMRH